MRGAYAFLLISILILARFGINLGAYSLDASIVGMYVLIVFGLLTAAFRVSLKRTALYGLCIAFAGLSLYANLFWGPRPNTSFGSLSLLALLYFPFVFVLRPQTLAQDDAAFALGLFLNLALFVACSGIAQFFLQFVYRPGWLFDFTDFIPHALRGSSHYNTVIPVGSLYKSNGFFLREPSGFGFLMALSFIAELHSGRRTARLALFGLGLLVSYSGTGILTLCIGVLFPLNLRTVLRVSALILGGLVIFFLLGEALNLGATLERVAEFEGDREHSSGHIRYIAPMRLIADTLFREPWTAVLGHGPGSISRETQLYEFFDPTWAKLLFEYGLLGTFSFLALFVSALRNPQTSPSVRAILFFCWLIMGGHLLSPSNNYLVLALAGILPRSPYRRAASVAAPSEAPITPRRPLAPAAARVPAAL